MSSEKNFSFRSKVSFPKAAIFFFSSFNADLMLDFAFPVTTNFSQSSLGDCFLDVMISTWSPLFKVWLNGTSL